ncbi:LysR substrate-binding domain-containing protein [Enterovirga rhinocerotis]|uniref:LysR substrate-binding domain-containing protein n=1 Tax=Enterovirga rhinocerotis TaxID=1339210 RepID=UPI001FE1FAA4|nr:LysR substrate-binding domain-containing protein [Enterovirga rhinocerotis]
MTAVRAFEAVARLGSATLAARELGVSPSAVSHQLALLDAFMEQPLTRRDGRGLALTEAGREYFRSVRTAFAVLRGATDQMRDGHRNAPVQLGVIPLFGRTWLFRHIGDFLGRNPDVELTVSYSHHRNYVSDSADLSVRFGDGQWKGYEAHRILSGAVAPFCSADLVARHPASLDQPMLLSTLPLVHDQDRNGWRLWFERHQSDRNPAPGLLVEDGNLALQAVLDGMGIALLRPSLVGALVDEGQLVRLSEEAMQDDRDYYLCHLSQQPLSGAEDRLLRWIIERCGADASAAPRRAPPDRR